ncbi:CDGSH iron-sulfur domain-containing protein [Streptomyces sp. NPDC051920]|uniref:CDGSH iron-sulfur domain-containing protein n=1 Tax=Streptomyces sp. NPDC051920 TaxID=3155523 RepID=UPI0034167CDA
MLIDGPVEVVLDDGSTATSERMVVAVCTCGRSRNYPWCDTSHRSRVTNARGSQDAASSTSRGSEKSRDRSGADRQATRPAAPDRAQ